MTEQLVGMVTHYFKGPSVAVVKLVDGALGVGDEIEVIDTVRSTRRHAWDKHKGLHRV